jgi:hypothetical protein
MIKQISMAVTKSAKLGFAFLTSSSLKLKYRTVLIIKNASSRINSAHNSPDPIIKVGVLKK